MPKPTRFIIVFLLALLGMTVSAYALSSPEGPRVGQITVRGHWYRLSIISEMKEAAHFTDVMTRPSGSTDEKAWKSHPVTGDFRSDPPFHIDFLCGDQEKLIDFRFVEPEGRGFDIGGIDPCKLDAFYIDDNTTDVEDLESR